MNTADAQDLNTVLTFLLKIRSPPSYVVTPSSDAALDAAKRLAQNAYQATKGKTIDRYEVEANWPLEPIRPLEKPVTRVSVKTKKGAKK